MDESDVISRILDFDAPLREVQNTWRRNNRNWSAMFQWLNTISENVKNNRLEFVPLVRYSEEEKQHEEESSKALEAQARPRSFLHRMSTAQKRVSNTSSEKAQPSHDSVMNKTIRRSARLLEQSHPSNNIIAMPKKSEENYNNKGQDCIAIDSENKENEGTDVSMLHADQELHSPPEEISVSSANKKVCRKSVEPRRATIAKGRPTLNVAINSKPSNGSLRRSSRLAEIALALEEASRIAQQFKQLKPQAKRNASDEVDVACQEEAAPGSAGACEEQREQPAAADGGDEGGEDEEYSDLDDDSNTSCGTVEETATPKAVFATPVQRPYCGKFTRVSQHSGAKHTKNAFNKLHKRALNYSSTPTGAGVSRNMIRTPVGSQNKLASIRDKLKKSVERKGHVRSNSLNCPSSHVASSFAKSKPKPPGSDSKDTVKLLEYKKKEQKEEERRKERECRLKEEIEEKKRKREIKMQKVAEARKKIEMQKMQQLEHAAESKKRLEEQRQEELRKKQAIRKQAESEKKQRIVQEKLAKQKELTRLNNTISTPNLQQKAVLNSMKAKVDPPSNTHETEQKMNTSDTRPEEKQSAMNSTYILDATEDQNRESYEMTPVPEPKKVETPPPDYQNYDIHDIKSDDETDDDQDPRKPIPKWAKGVLLRAAVRAQILNPPDLDELFGLMPELDLTTIFGIKSRHLLKRTSSAVWNSPPFKRMPH